MSIATFDVECSTPENLYEPGDTVRLIMRCETDSDFGKRHDPARVYFSKGNGREQGDKFIGWSDGYFEDKDGEDWSHQWNTTTELYGKFPVNPQDGDVIAIIFDVTPASGMDGSGYEQNYGGHMFYEWIYTYIA